MKEVGFHQDARMEFEDAERESPDRIRFRKEVESVIDSIAIGRIVPQKIRPKHYRRYVFTRLPYSLIFRDRDGEIRVFAFAHHKRRPGYWRDRLNDSPP